MTTPSRGSVSSGSKTFGPGTTIFAVTVPGPGFATGARTPAGSVTLPTGVGGIEPGFLTLSCALHAGQTITPAASGRALTSARQRGQIMGGGKYTGLDGVGPCRTVGP